MGENTNICPSLSREMIGIVKSSEYKQEKGKHFHLGVKHAFQCEKLRQKDLERLKEKHVSPSLILNIPKDMRENTRSLFVNYGNGIISVDT